MPNRDVLVVHYLACVRADEMPLNASGKVDRMALKKIAEAHVGAEPKFVGL
jgi:acyl-coenzyme A synthetase/AMP-(fatty) acid ligase